MTERINTTRNAIILADEQHDDMTAVFENCHALIAAFSNKGLRVTVVTGFDADVIETKLSEHDVTFVRNTVWANAGKAESLRCGLGVSSDDARLLVCNSDAIIDDATLADLLDDKRTNLLAVSLQLPSQMHPEGLKFQMEPIDVPWYSRRVMRLSRTLDHRMCHGRPIGFAMIGSETVPELRSLLSDLSETDRETLASEEVFDRLITAGIDFFTHVAMAATERLAV